MFTQTCQSKTLEELWFGNHQYKKLEEVINLNVKTNTKSIFCGSSKYYIRGNFAKDGTILLIPDLYHKENPFPLMIS